MTVNISKHLLGIACINAGAFTPPILVTLTLMPPEFDPADAARLIHFITTPMLLTVMVVTVLVNLGSRRKPAAGEGTAWSNCPGTPPLC